MRSVSWVVAATVLLSPAIGCRTPPGKIGDPIVAGKRVTYANPEAKPPWSTNLQQWLKKHPDVEGRAIVGVGDGFDQSHASMKAFEAAVKKGRIPTKERGALKLLENWIIGYSDGSYTICALYEYAKPGAAESLDKGAQKLCGGLLERIPPAKRQHLKTVAVGDFCYKNTGFRSEFGDLLRTAVLTALQAKLGEAAAGRESLLQKFKGDAALVMEVLDPNTTKPHDESKDEPLADALITGSFWPDAHGHSVLVQASIREPASGALLGGASANISVERLAVEIAPGKIAVAQKNIDALNNLRKRIVSAPGGKQNFKIRLWPKNARQVWKAGEKFAINFRSERDCYLNLLHVDPNGKVQLLFPNQWQQDALVRGGREYTIPNAAMNFDWNIVPPFGVDTIMAVATATRTPRLFEFRPGKDVAFRAIGDDQTRGIEIVAEQITASMENLPADQKAEAVTTITTVGQAGEEK